jgi:hypothetical protein
MKWNVYPNLHPKVSGAYLVCIEKKQTDNIFLFKYVAYYSNAKWYKLDPFLRIGNVKEEIQDRITAWTDIELIS